MCDKQKILNLLQAQSDPVYSMFICVQLDQILKLQFKLHGVLAI